MTVRNNVERLGIEHLPHSPDPLVVLAQKNQEQENKPDIGFPQPTELIDLPTKGRFYPKEHPLYNVETVEIRYMTTKDLEILNSRTLLQKGVALDKMIQGLLINKNIKVDELFIGDKNAIVLAARITGFDAGYSTKVTCPACGEKTTHEFNLNEARKVKEVGDDIQIADDGTFDLKLPKSGAVLTLKLLTGGDEKALRMQAEKWKKLKMPERPITDQLKQIIVSIDGETDLEVISKFVDNMLAIDSRFVKDEYARISPNVDLTQNFECESCYTESQLNIPFTADFFWPNR